MPFYLPFDIKPYPKKISRHHLILLMGSCFSGNFTRYFQRYKFGSLGNPFGKIFNPVSIANNLMDAMTMDCTMDSFEKDGIYYCWQAHSYISSTSHQLLKQTYRETIIKTHDFLKTTDWLFITFGSAKVYYLKESGLLVANCHKHPGSNFTEQTLSVHQITKKYNELLNSLFDFNPKLKIVFTISPVRYAKDGLVGNNISKSILNQAVHELIDGERSYYFPAYEIMIDELRDYRFYNVDRVHPSEEAIDYIWNKLKDAFFDSKTMDFTDNWDLLLQRINHNTMHKSTEMHQKFVNSTIALLKKYENEINIKPELDVLKSQLIP